MSAACVVLLLAPCSDSAWGPAYAPTHPPRACPPGGSPRPAPPIFTVLCQSKREVLCYCIVYLPITCAVHLGDSSQIAVLRVVMPALVAGLLLTDASRLADACVRACVRARPPAPWVKSASIVSWLILQHLAIGDIWYLRPPKAA